MEAEKGDRCVEVYVYGLSGVKVEIELTHAETSSR